MTNLIDTILSSNIFLVSSLAIYFFSVNIGFGPLKYTLLSEMFSPKEQVTLKEQARFEIVNVICESESLCS